MKTLWDLAVCTIFRPRWLTWVINMINILEQGKFQSLLPSFAWFILVPKLTGGPRLIQVSNSSCMGSSRPKRQYMLWGLSRSDTSGWWGGPPTGKARKIRISTVSTWTISCPGEACMALVAIYQWKLIGNASNWGEFSEMRVAVQENISKIILHSYVQIQTLINNIAKRDNTYSS